MKLLLLLTTLLGCIFPSNHIFAFTKTTENNINHKLEVLNDNVLNKTVPLTHLKTPTLLPNIQYSPTLVINEVMASNDRTIEDNSGKSSDWIEIYNPTSSPVDLANYYITDNPSNLTKYRFGSTSGQVVVPANGYKIIWASGNDLVGHTSWSLSADGENVVLVAPDGTTIIDQMTFPAQRTDVSYGRMPGSPNTLVFFSPSSPGAANLSVNAYQGFLTPPTFSHNGGIYTSNFDLSITSSGSGETLYYTNDGSDPDPSNLSGTSFQYKNTYPSGSFLNQSYITRIYSSSINITDRSSSPNSVSMKASAGRNTHTYFPSSPITKGTVIRVQSRKAGYIPSEIVTHTYFRFSSPTKYSFPLHSVVLPEKDLFDYWDGFYTPGIHYDTIANQNIYCPRGNYYLKDLFEKQGSFEYFEAGSRKIGGNVIYKIHGGCSTQNPKKSLRVRSKDPLPHPLFSNLPGKEYEQLVLRTGGNEDANSMIRDAFFHDISNKLDFEYMESTPSITFINGEYWGITNIRERIADNYLATRVGVNKDKLDLIEFSGGTLELKEGSLTHYNAMMSFVNANNLAVTTNYNTLLTMIDEQNVLDYLIAEIFSGNNDWPLSNLRMWRSNADLVAGKKFFDGKWRYILYDVDMGLNFQTSIDHHTLNHVLNPAVENTLLFRKMMESPLFKDKLLNRLSDILNTHYLSTRTRSVLTSWRNRFATEMPEHIARWSEPYSMSYWHDNVDNIDSFLNQRPGIVREQFRAKYSISGTYNLTVISSDTTHGTTKVNSIVINTSTPGVPANYKNWTGVYYQNKTLELKAVPKFGYKFSHWTVGGVASYDSVYTVNTSSNFTITVHFVPAPVSDNPIPPAFTSLNQGCKYTLFEWNSSTPAGSKPPSAEFVYFNDTDPSHTSKISGFTAGAFNHGSGTRINGKNALGVSFINTGGGSNPTYVGSKIGGMILALNTVGLDSVKITWKGRTHTINNTEYAIRLQYREADLEDPSASTSNFLDFSPIVNYPRGASVGDSTVFSVYLPSSILNKPYVQLLWRYYRVAPINGSRDELGIDDIVIYGVKRISSHPLNTVTAVQNPAHIYSTAKVQGTTANVEYKAGNSILLTPGFESSPGTVFKASISGCSN